MATTEAGGGVPSGELRERLIDLADGLMNATWREDVEGLINAVLAEIAAAGVELVPTERMDRLRAIAREHPDTLRAGDLD